MRAGTVVPATVQPNSGMGAGSLRSMRAGTVVPATVATLCVPAPRSSPLNEGRDRSPGDRFPSDAKNLHVLKRSMRAGTVVPTTALLLFGGRDRMVGTAGGSLTVVFYWF